MSPLLQVLQQQHWRWRRQGPGGGPDGEPGSEEPGVSPQGVAVGRG